jgi:hypothetical protein
MTNPMSRNQCISAHKPAWQLHAIRPARFRSARQYSRFSPDLLKFFAFHRTATARQVLRFHSELLGDRRSERSVRMHLQTLVAAGDLAVLRARGMNEPNLYIVTGKGLRAVGDSFQLSADRRRRPTGSHLAHELLISEIAIGIRETTRQLPSLTIEWEERFGFAKHDCFGELVPDYAFLASQAGRRMVCLAEVSSGEESVTRLQEKLLAYEIWSDTDEAQRFLIELYRARGASQPKAHFRLLCVMHNRLAGEDELRVRQLLQAAAELTPIMRRRIWCTTADALGTASDFAAPIWLRLSDFESLFGEPGANRRKLTRALSKAINAASRHALFLREAGP